MEPLAMTPDPSRLEALLAETAWVRALARRLCSDSAAAEDLVQDTWLAALRHRPDERSSPRAWLGKVLVNLNLARRRSEANRGARERVAARGERLPSSSDVVERVQNSRALVEHVLELEEPYRSAVLARFFDGLSAEEIARREHLPSSTIRTRIQRGIEKLRTRLQREKGANWLGALAPLAHVASSTGAMGTGIAGGLVMAAGTKIALVLCAAGLSTWLLWPRVQPVQPALEPPAQPVLAAQPPNESPAAPPTERKAAGTAPVAARVPIPPPVQPATNQSAPGSIQGLVVGRHDASEVPVEGAEVCLWSTSDAAAERVDPNAPPEGSTRSQADGTFQFANLQPGNYFLKARRGTGPWHQARARVPERGPGLTVRIAFGETRVHGHVYDELGVPLADFPLSIHGGAPGVYGIMAEATTAGDGAFAFESLSPGDYTGFLTSNLYGSWPARSWRLELADGDDLELDVGEPRPIAHWRGTIRYSNGEPAKGPFKLRLQRKQHTAKGSNVTTIRHLLLGDNPCFDVTLDSANWVPTVGIGSNIEQGKSWDEVTVGRGDMEHDLVLHGARLTGRVLDSITLQPLAGYSGKLEFGIRRAGSSDAMLRPVEVFENSRYAIDMLGEGRWELISMPLLIASSGNKLEFTIGPGEIEKQLDVPVQKP
jgi:RNA polymerase sigma-70 factor (ECF subfamily)